MNQTKNLTGLAILVAIIIVLQLFSTFFSSFLPMARLTLSLVPIVIGGAIYGIKAGALLGGVFGTVVVGSMIAGFGGEFGTLIFQNMPFLSVGITLLRCIMAGLIPAIVFKIISKWNLTIAAVISALLCPVVNTGLFCLGVIFVFKDIFLELNGGGNVYLLLISAITANFIIEFIINIILSPVILTVIKVRSNK